MRIAEMTEIGRIEYREVPVPRAGPGELVMRTRAVGLCGTDLKAFVRGHPYFKPPCILGHEFAGTISEVGEGVEDFALGESVVAAPY
ncbi:alcohol dehydrogenase catalytic domain-containing protein, partial [Candidatus Bipolaricaulota bacterium]|nr:alcohol dehydrogenase catalytic domain-containing protein [Candidatus Bipolaricaulota bacterium]